MQVLTEDFLLVWLELHLKPCAAVLISGDDSAIDRFIWSLLQQALSLPGEEQQAAARQMTLQLSQAGACSSRSGILSVAPYLLQPCGQRQCCLAPTAWMHS